MDKDIQIFISKARGSIMRLWGKLYTAEQLYNTELLATNFKPYPKNEEIEDYVTSIIKTAYQKGYKLGNNKEQQAKDDFVIDTENPQEAIKKLTPIIQLKKEEKQE